MSDYLNQWGLASDPQFQRRCQQAGVDAAVAVANEAVDDVQTVTITGTATGGTFTLTWSGQTTATIAWNSSAGAVQLALQNLSNVGNGNVACTGGPLPGTGITVTFDGTLGNTAQVAMTIGTNSLTGTGSPTPVVTHTTIGASVADHANRNAFAIKVLASPQSYAPLFAFVCANNATVFADFTNNSGTTGWVLASGKTETGVASDILFVVNGSWSNFSG